MKYWLARAEARAQEAEARLAEARAGFESQLATILAEPMAFARQLPERRKKRRARALARRRVKAAVKRLVRENRELRECFEDQVRDAGAEREVRPLTSDVEKVARRSFGFGNPRAVETPAFIAPPPPPPVAVDLGPVERRLLAIETKLDDFLARGEADDGIKSRFRDGRKAGVDPGDPRAREKGAILRKLLEENVRLQKGHGTTTKGEGGKHGT